MSANRVIMAWKYRASPAAARATISFNPNREVRPNRTNRSRNANSASASAAAGSAWYTAASKQESNRPNDSDDSFAAISWSTRAAACWDRCRVAAATRRA